MLGIRCYCLVPSRRTLCPCFARIAAHGAEKEWLIEQRRDLVHFRRHHDVTYSDLYFEPTPPMSYVYCYDDNDLHEEMLSQRRSLALAFGHTGFWICGGYGQLASRLQIAQQDSSSVRFAMFSGLPLLTCMLWRVAYKMWRWHRQSKFRQLQRARLRIVYRAGVWQKHLHLVVSKDTPLLPCLQHCFQHMANLAPPLPPLQSCWFYIEDHRLSSEQQTLPLRQISHALGLADFRTRTLTLTVVDGRVPTFLMGLHPQLGVASTARALRCLDRRVVKNVLLKFVR